MIIGGIKYLPLEEFIEKHGKRHGFKNPRTMATKFKRLDQANLSREGENAIYAIVKVDGVVHLGRHKSNYSRYGKNVMLYEKLPTTKKKRSKRPKA